MKKLVVLMAAAGFALSAMAEVVTLTHSEAGALASELSECGVDVASITELAIVGDAEMTAADFDAIRSSMSKTLQKLDLSQALFADNTLPSTNVKTAGVLNNMAITECILPESLTALGDGAFVKCTKLKKVNVPEGVKIIPQYCFSNCLALSDITLSESIVRILDFAFEKCTKLPFEELPPYLLSIGQKAFNATNVAFSRLPETLTGNGLGQLCFANTNVSFTEIPAGMTALKEGIFLGTKVNFTSLPEQITLAEKRVFENVRTLTYFEITDVAGLSTTIPPAFFYIANDDVERTFVCRSMTPPAATVSTTDATGSFGKVAEFKNTTFRVPLGALAAYAEVEPYSTMNLLPISVKVAAPEVEMPYNVAPEHIKVAYVVGDIEHSDFDKEVCEGEGKLVVSFADEADDYLYVSEIHGKKAVATMAEGEDDADAMTLLYACEEAKAKDNLKAQVEIPVSVNDAMDTHHIVISRYSEPSGISDVAADASYSRRGDVLDFSAPGARLFDMTGVCVRRADGLTMSLTGLPGGVYVVSVGTGYIKILK